jgi:hypothetical protein
VRLTLDQSANAVRGLLGDEAANSIVADLGLGVSSFKTFPPLNGPREGGTVIPSLFDKIDKLAADGGQYVYDHFGEVTGCPASEDCVRQFLAAFAERAYRRPLLPSERDDLDQQISEALTIGASPRERRSTGSTRC